MEDEKQSAAPATEAEEPSNPAAASARQQGYFFLLNVKFDCTEEELTKKYKKLALKYHPDRNPDNAEASKATSVNTVIINPKYHPHPIQASVDHSHTVVFTREFP